MNVARRLALFVLLGSFAAATVSAQTVPSSPAEQSPPSAAPTLPSSQSSTPAPTAPNGQAASAPTAGNTIRTTARLVVLDAVVVDKQGHAVTDLNKEQFHVQEDGAAQTVLNFVAPGHFTPPADATIDSTADLDRLAPRAPVNIILLDEFNTLFEDMAFARYSLGKWLKSQPDKLDTPTMLVSVSLEKFQVLHDYTQNKQELLDALDHHFSAYPWQAHNFSWISERYATAFYTLRRVAEASTGHVGHKNMIWIGRGLPSIDNLRFTSFDRDRINTAVQQTVNELRDARITLYTIDPAGVMIDPGRYGREAALFEPFGGQQDFKSLARATGGRNLFGRNDVDAEIGTSIRDGASFYTLTYRPTNTARDVSHFRRITVSVEGRPDLTVVTRQGYFDSRAPARLTADGQVTRRLASEIAGAETSTMVYDAVPLTLTVGDNANKYLIHMNGHNLYWTPSDGTTPRTTRLIITVSTFDKKDKMLKTDAREITLTAKPGVAPTGPLDGNVVVPCDGAAGFQSRTRPLRRARRGQWSAWAQPMQTCSTLLRKKQRAARVHLHPLRPELSPTLDSPVWRSMPLKVRSTP